MHRNTTWNRVLVRLIHTPMTLKMSLIKKRQLEFLPNSCCSLPWNTRLFNTIFSTKLSDVLWTIFNLSVRDSALELCRPNLFTQMSAQKTVAFIKTWKNLVDREETGYYGGQRRHLLTLYQMQRWGIWGTEGPGICQSVFLVLLLSPTQTTKAPLRQPPFLSEQAHKASCTRLQLSSTERTTSCLV